MLVRSSSERGSETGGMIPLSFVHMMSANELFRVSAFWVSSMISLPTADFSGLNLLCAQCVCDMFVKQSKIVGIYYV